MRFSCGGFNIVGFPTRLLIMVSTMVRTRVNCFTGYLVEESEVEMEASDFIKVSMEIFG